MATFHENLVQSFKNFRDKYLKANGVVFQFSYDSTTGKFGYKDANGNFVPFRRVQASKTVSPSTSSQTVTPDSGYDGIASVTVNAVNLQSKTTTMTPPSPSSWSATTTKLGTVTPDSGYTGLSQADISIPMIPDNTTLTLQSSGSDYDTYKPSRAGYVFTSSYLKVPKSGGSETTLWENSSPTSSFGSQTVTLNNSISNYKYLKIVNRRNNTDATETEVIVSVDYFKQTANSNGSKICLTGTMRTQNGSSFNIKMRYFYYVSDTSVGFSAGHDYNWNAGSGVGSGNCAIPTKIIGIK